VLTPIDLYYQAPLQTNEIHNVGIERMLSPELAVRDLTVSPPIPQQTFRIGLVLS